MSPADSLTFLEHYGVGILPALVVAEQIGVPLPAVPALLAVRAPAAHGRISIALVLGAISCVALAMDFVWYELGRAVVRGSWGDSAACPSSRTRACAGPRTSSPATARGACSSRNSSPG